VTRFLVWCVLIALPAFGADAQLDPLLKKVENRYNRSQSLKLDFSETYIGIGHAPSRTESGVLLLKKPGRMRWEYSSPAGKLFLSDGKNVFLYTPDQRLVEKSKLKESDDMRTPLAFLLGKLDFSKEFKSFESRPEGPNVWIAAEPKNPNLEYTRVEFLVSPEGEILKLKVASDTSARMEFSFSHETLNPPVTEAEFEFHPPAGVEIRDAGQ
jgi:outer membrane lipoprotein carrier protein